MLHMWSALDLCICGIWFANAIWLNINISIKVWPGVCLMSCCKRHHWKQRPAFLPDAVQKGRAREHAPQRHSAPLPHYLCCLPNSFSRYEWNDCNVGFFVSCRKWTLPSFDLQTAVNAERPGRTGWVGAARKLKVMNAKFVLINGVLTLDMCWEVEEAMTDLHKCSL